MDKLLEKYLKGKKITFYKAFAAVNGSTIDIHKEGEIFFMEEHNAVEYLINELAVNEASEIIDKRVIIFKIIIPKEEFDLETRTNIGGKSVTVRINDYGEHITFKISEYTIDTAELTFDTGTGTRLLKEISMTPINVK